MNDSLLALMLSDIKLLLSSRATEVTEPVFFVCVTYRLGESDTFPPPLIGLGLDRERRESRSSGVTRRRAEQSGKDYHLAGFYQPGNYSLIRAPGFRFAPSEALSQALAAMPADDASVVAFYNSVAIALRGTAWPFAVTDDFCVFATDRAMRYWEMSFRATVDHDVRVRLAADGWIPRFVAVDPGEDVLAAYPATTDRVDIDRLMCPVCKELLRYDPEAKSAVAREVGWATVRGASSVSLTCPNCSAKLALNVSSGMLAKRSDLPIKCPLPACTGYIFATNAVPVDHVGEDALAVRGPVHLCGECGSIWKRRESLIEQIRASVAKFPHRAFFYEITPTDVLPIDQNPTTALSERIESEPREHRDTFVMD